MRSAVVSAIALALGLAATAAAHQELAPRRPAPVSTAAPAAPDGRALYDRLCLACHGFAGRGNGPASPFLWPRPRDFSRGEYKWRTTSSGEPPRADDLRTAIAAGVPGTSMHAFGAFLSPRQLDALIDILVELGPAGFALASTPTPVPAPPPPAVERGAAVWRELGCDGCHGAEGRGDGPAAAAIRDTLGRPSPPYDLTARPLRRPGARDVVAIYTSLVTGLTGTAMPAYAGAASEADLWAVASYVDALRYRPGPGAPPQPEPTSVDVLAVATSEFTEAGYWPGDPSSPDAAIWGEVLRFQGEPAPTLAPAQRSLAPAQCGRCHAKQLREWRGSLHSKTASPGLYGQVLRIDDRGRESCMRCHAPLAEQQPRVRPAHRGGEGEGYADNPLFDPELRDASIACAACHVRDWRRYGPPRIAEAKLLGLPSYPLTELAIYERADFCLPCHQLPPRLATRIVDAKDDSDKRKPPLNTYREWVESPYMRRGIQCQHCHMPNREHSFLGVHDPDTFRQGVTLEAIAARSATTGAVSVRARLTNVGAGHYLPTTPTPAVFLTVELLDGDHAPIAGAADQLRIGRLLAIMPGGKFRQLADTRIPPGASAELSRAWRGGDVGRARYARVRVRVHPDEHYEHLFAARLRGELSREVRDYFEAAHATTRGSTYVAIDRELPIAEPR